MSKRSIRLSELNQWASELEIDLVGLSDLTAMDSEVEHLNLWQRKGHAGEMKFMQHESGLYASSNHILAATRSVLSCSLRYSSAPHPALKPGYGRIARYAWGQDYHVILRERLLQLVLKVQQNLDCEVTSRVFTDALPFLERAAGRSAGLGFIGKNTLLIRKGVGSFFFLGEVFWNIEIVADVDIALPDHNGCGSCSRCINDCPTEALVQERILDARRCISYLTIEKHGVLSTDELRAIGEWSFGCDICQDVCPFNHQAMRGKSLAVIGQFAPHAGVGPLLNLADVLNIRSNREFDRAFAGTPLLRARKTGLQRNAIAVAVNTDARQLRPEIEALAEQTNSAVLQQTAHWALSQWR